MNEKNHFFEYMQIVKDKELCGKVKRVQCSPLTENDRLMVEEIAERWKASKSKVIGIALHEWLKTNFKSYE